MRQAHIESLLQEGIIEGKRQEMELIETHISWLILTDDFVYKIKKPIQYPFLDFSSLDQRKYYCQRELFLNRRLSDIYLELIPIYEFEDRIYVGESEGELLDYAVKMRRLAAYQKMDVVVKAGKLTKEHIDKLARKIADFHQSAETISKDFDIAEYQENFNDFGKLEPQLAEFLGVDAQEILKKSMELSDQFLIEQEEMIKSRAKQGYVRDLHGDLHAKNIFVYEDPIIFDCIEFNDAFRQIDVLNDVAFFCMDLEAHGKQDLSDLFMDLYVQKFPCINSANEIFLFTYFKAYRANVRAKVNLLRAMQAENPRPHIDESRKYLELMEKYMQQLGIEKPKEKAV